MNMSHVSEIREDEMINFFKKKEHIFDFLSDETIVKQAMDKFGLTETAAKSYNQEYTVRFRTQLNNFIKELEEKKMQKEDMISACVEKFSLKRNEIKQYIRRLHLLQQMDEMTQKLFEGVYF